MPRLSAQLAELGENPPPEFFLGLYFRANYGWTPFAPDRVVEETQEEPEIPAALLPEFEP